MEFILKKETIFTKVSKETLHRNNNKIIKKDFKLCNITFLNLKQCILNHINEVFVICT